jgi:hypothetical protein
MDLIKFDNSKIDLLKLNHPYFYDRLYFSLKEDGNDIKYGEFASRIMKNGAVKVLKSLGIYIVKGARYNKTTYIHEKLQLIIKTTIADNYIVSETILDLVNGKYTNIKPIKIDDYSMFYSLDDNYPCSTDNSKCTYIIYNPENKLYKIGRSSNVFDRLNSLRNEISYKLELIFYIDNDIECLLHKEYVDFRMFGEWFDLSIDHVLDIKNKHNGKIIQLINR